MPVSVNEALRHHLQLWLPLPDPTCDPDVALLRRFEVRQILRQSCIIKLQQKLGLDTDINLTDLVDDLTFGHGRFTFKQQIF